MFWLLQYAKEVGHAFVPKKDWPNLVIKVFVWLSGIIAVLTLTNRASIHVVSSGGEPMWETNQIELRWVAYGLAMLALLIWACGAAWVRVFTFRVDDEVICDRGQHFLAIKNLGFSDIPVLVRMEKVADEKGLRKDWNARFPLVLFHETISRGFPRNVLLIKDKFIGSFPDLRYLFDVNDVEDSNRCAWSLGPLNQNEKNKLWFKIAISAVNRSMWFSVQLGDGSPIPVIVAHEDPPHIQRRGFWERWFSEED